MDSEKELIIPPDFDRCQVYRPSTWPHMPGFMTLGPVSHKRCENVPVWIAHHDDGGCMTLCDECKHVGERVMKEVEFHLLLHEDNIPGHNWGNNGACKSCGAEIDDLIKYSRCIQRVLKNA